MDANKNSNEDLRGLLWLLGLGASAFVGLLLMQAFHTPASHATGTLRQELASTVDDWMGLSGGPAEPGVPARIPVPRVGLGTYATSVQDENDPQMQAFRQSYRAEEDAGITQPFSIAYYRGTLLSTSGVPGLNAGAACEVRVLPVASAAFNCLLRVVCNDVIVYPDERMQAGYAPCEIESGQVISAVDDSSFDGDREINLNTRTRIVSVNEVDELAVLMSLRIQLES